MLKALYTTLSDSASAVIHLFGQSPTISPAITLADLTVYCLVRSWATNYILKGNQREIANTFIVLTFTIFFELVSSASAWTIKNIWIIFFF